jgi:hypothetical protein
VRDEILAVLDTNVLISGFLWNKLPSQLIDLMFEDKFTNVTSRVLIAELSEVLSRDKFAERLKIKGYNRFSAVERIRQVSYIVEPVDIHPIVLDDPDDDVLIATALATPVDCIVTGNKHLLNLGEYQGIPIYRVEQFLRLFDLQK